MKKRNFNRLDKRKYGYIFLASVIIVVVIIGVWKVKFSKPSSDNIDGFSSVANIEDFKEEKKALVATKDLMIGDFVTRDSYEENLIEGSTAPLDVVEDPEYLLNKRIKTPINEGEPIGRNNLIDGDIWYEDDDRLTEYAFVEGTIPTIVPRERLVGSFVDIMLYKHQAKDELVISKAMIVAQDGNKLGFHFNLEEDEYLREAGAEGNFYFRMYLDDSQEASEVTYVPGYKIEGE